MRYVCALGALYLVLCGRLSAQELPRAEVFGGYSYLRADTNISGWPTNLKLAVITIISQSFLFQCRCVITLFWLARVNVQQIVAKI
jgi:hypothetical protein